MYRLRWYLMVFHRWGASNKGGVGKRAIFEQNALISLTRWRWWLLHYFKQVVNLTATSSHRIGAVFDMLSRCMGLSAASAGLSYWVISTHKQTNKQKRSHYPLFCRCIILWLVSQSANHVIHIAVLSEESLSSASAAPCDRHSVLNTGCFVLFLCTDLSQQNANRNECSSMQLTCNFTTLCSLYVNCTVRGHSHLCLQTAF